MSMAIAGIGSGVPINELSGDRNAATQSRQAVTASQGPESAGPSDIDTTTKELEQISLAFNKKLKFSVNRDLDEVVVKVIDPSTDKIVKEIPSEALQKLHLKIKEMIGILFDESV